MIGTQPISGHENASKTPDSMERNSNLNFFISANILVMGNKKRLPFYRQPPFIQTTKLNNPYLAMTKRRTPISLLWASRSDKRYTPPESSFTGIVMV